MQDVLDYKLQHWLRKCIADMSPEARHQLRNIYHCGEVSNNPQSNAVFVLSNGKRAALFGQHTCKNSFACPVCSARIMLRHRTKIACAIDALKPKGLRAYMVTFVIPHLRFMKCKENVDILYNSWYLAFRNKSSKRVTKSGQIRKSSPIHSWFVDSDIEYYLRVSEYTWGENGWNPHFHALFWIPEDKVETFKSYESQICEYWGKVVRREMLKYWEKNNLYWNDEIRSKLLARVFHAHDKGLGGLVKFSQHEAQTSDYVSGWGAEKEVTGNVQKKATHEGHFTPYEILSFAAEEKSFDDVMANVYKDFLLSVTRKPVHRRIEYSKGLHQIITVYQQTEKYHEFLAKKKGTPATWEVVCWFTREDWLKLCKLSIERDEPIIWMILSATAKMWGNSALERTKTRQFLKLIADDYGITAHFLPHPFEDCATKAFNYIAA